MKQLFKIAGALLLFAGCSQAETNKSNRPSPPATMTTSVNGLEITINYSQPALKGRVIGKDVAPAGQVWRTGANEATTFEVNKDVRVDGKKLDAGKYGLFTIPGDKEWVVIFNKEHDQWGASRYDAGKDALRFSVQPEKVKKLTERMTFTYDTGRLALLWGDTRVAFTVQE